MHYLTGNPGEVFRARSDSLLDPNVSMPPSLASRVSPGSPAHRARSLRPAGVARPAPLLRPAPLAAVLALLLVVAACDGEPEWAPFEDGWDPNHPQAAQVLAPPDPGDPIDVEMANAGERWFRVRGCLACHRVDGVDVAGPYLNGVTVRRDYDWFRGMVLRPDSMIQVDPIARDLAEIYRVPMPNQGVNDLHVRALWEYLRRVDAGGGADG